MIRELIESDQDYLYKYLSVEEQLNMYILLIHRFHGWKSDVVKLYGEFDEDNNYISVSLFTTDQIIFYSHNRLFNTEWLKIFESHEFTYISGEKDTISNIIPCFKEFIILPSYLAEATYLTQKHEKSNYNIVKVTTKEQVEKIYYLLKSIAEYEYRTKDKQAFISSRMITLNYGSTYYIEENGKVISTASANGETDKTAVIMMVGTALEARNKGLASTLLKHLMNEYIEIKKKSLCLFYDNPKAGSVYNKLGFEEIHKWIVLKRNL